MLRTRPPAVAGSFYPADPKALRALVRSCLDAAQPGADAPAKAFVVPHAGYVYSGPVAATAYARIATLRDRVRRIVLIGPSHRVAFRGIALPEAEIFETPLGAIEIDQEAVARALQCPGVLCSDAAHAGEHSLEVQLPFLQTVLDRFALVPLVVGRATPREVAEVIEALWGGDETLVLVSSDLSHYLPYDDARALDARTSRAIETLSPDEISEEQACGRLGVQALLAVARQHRLRASTLDLRNSGDTAGSRDAVVGYGAYALG